MSSLRFSDPYLTVGSREDESDSDSESESESQNTTAGRHMCPRFSSNSPHNQSLACRGHEKSKASASLILGESSPTNVYAISNTNLML